MILRNKILLMAALQKPILHNLFGSIGNFAIDSNGDGLADGVTRSSGVPCALENNIQSFIPQAQYNGIKLDWPIPEGHVGYYCIYVQTLAPSVFIQTPVSDGTGNNVGVSTNENFIFISRRSAYFNSDYMQIASGSSSTYGEINVKRAFCFDLTVDFGVGKEPLKADMDTFMRAQIEYFINKEYVPAAV